MDWKQGSNGGKGPGGNEIDQIVQGCLGCLGLLWAVQGGSRVFFTSSGIFKESLKKVAETPNFSKSHWKMWLRFQKSPFCCWFLFFVKSYWKSRLDFKSPLFVADFWKISCEIFLNSDSWRLPLKQSTVALFILYFLFWKKTVKNHWDFKVHILSLILEKNSCGIFLR